LPTTITKTTGLKQRVNPHGIGTNVILQYKKKAAIPMRRAAPDTALLEAPDAIVDAVGPGAIMEGPGVMGDSMGLMSGVYAAKPIDHRKESVNSRRFLSADYYDTHFST